MSAGQGFSISSTSSSSTDSTSRADSGGRTKPSDSDVQRFERAMQRRQGNEKQGKGDESQGLEDWERLRLQAQMDPAVALGASTPVAAQPDATPPVSAVTPASLDSLIAQYVEMLAVSDPSKTTDPRVMLKLDASLLPHTELFLTKAPEGWVLQANTRSPDAFRLLSEYGPALERRFSMRGLGALRLETTMQPSAIDQTQQPVTRKQSAR